MPVVPYAEACTTLKTAADLLRLPWSTVATALVFLHRFQVNQESRNLQPNVCILEQIAAQILPWTCPPSRGLASFLLRRSLLQCVFSWQQK